MWFGHRMDNYLPLALWIGFPLIHDPALASRWHLGQGLERTFGFLWWFAWSSTSQCWASGSLDDTIRLWKADGSLIAYPSIALTALQASVCSSLGPNGQIRVNLWKWIAVAGQYLQLGGSTVWLGHRWGVTSLQIRRNGLRPMDADGQLSRAFTGFHHECRLVTRRAN